MNAPYGPVPIGMLLVLLYGLSVLFVRLDVLSKSAHRRIWNYALLLTFLIAAGLGILLAVQVNARVAIPWTEKALKVHVNFGLAMAVIAAFHLLGRASYFFPRMRKAAAATPEKASAVAPTSPAFFAPAGIGFSGVLVQSLLIRDFLTLFEGNELTVSLVISLWLLVTGAGSLAGTGSGLSDRLVSGRTGLKAGLMVRTLFLVPLVLFPLMFLGKTLLFAPGVEAGPLPMSGFLLAILLPFCFLNGFSFTWTARLLRREGHSLGKTYAWESAGGAAGGIFCTAAILLGIPSLEILAWAGSFFFFLYAAFSPVRGRRQWLLPAALAAVAVLFQVFDVDRMIQKRFHPHEELVGTATGSSGRLTVTRSGGQWNVYGNGILVHASGNSIVDEELATFTLVQVERPKSVLVIGGLLTGLPAEAVKFGCERVDCLEPDPRLIGLAEKLGLIGTTPEVRLIRKTPAAWLRDPDGSYAAVMIDLPGPLTLSLNRFYTEDFFRRVRNVLEPGGVVAAVLPGTANYVSENALATFGPIIRAAHDAFGEVLIFPGENSYLLMSDRPLSTDILAGLESRGIKNTYVNPGYFDETLFRDRVERLNRDVGPSSVSNSDLRPIAFLAQIRWWLGRFPENVLYPGAGLLAILLLFGIFSRNTRLAGMFVMGAASSGWTVTLLLLAQIAAGAIYQWTGLILGMFMIGLAAGSLLGTKMGRSGARTGAALPLAVFMAISAAAAFLSPGFAYGRGSAVLKLLILLGTGLAIAATVGACFSAWALKLDPESGKQDRLYGYDLLGSAAGAIGFPLVAIPLAGLQNALYILTLAGGLVLLLTLPAGRSRMSKAR